MDQPTLSRRNLLATSVPALGAAAGLLTASNAFAQQDVRTAPAVPNTMVGHDGTKYVLPPLPYAPDALEPHVDAATMSLHHDQHHKKYVDDLNKATAKLAELLKSETIDPATLEGVQRDVSFNAGGHVLHTLFWNTMAPNAGGPATGAVAGLIDKAYGSFAAFQKYFTAVATGIKGSGWAVLAYEPVGRGLVTVALGDQDLRLVAGSTPILGIDVWEHSYYLKYQNRRPEYVKAWWNTVSWDGVNTVLGMAMR